MLADKSKGRVYFFIGTTAELIKLFPVIRELENRKIDFKIITSGQTAIQFNEVSSWIKKRQADFVLPGKKNESSVPLFIIWTFRTLANAFILFQSFRKIDKAKTYFVVHGDTISSLIGAIIVRIFNFKLVHIESGLRSFNFLEPFPEEISRYLVSRIAQVHFSPNKWSVRNLSNVGGIKINTFQNTLIESYRLARDTRPRSKRITGGKKYFIFILHRQEHVVFSQEKSRKLTEFVLNNLPADLSCVFVSHATTSVFLSSIKSKLRKKFGKRLAFIPRMPYLEFIHLMRGSEFIVTDGGSNQEEAYYMGLPCLLLRNNTERVEGLGENVILSKNNKKKIKSFLRNYKTFEKGEVKVEKRPSKIIVDYLLGE